MIIAMPSMPRGNSNRFTKNGLPKLVNVLLIVPLAFGFSKLSEQILPAPAVIAPAAALPRFTTIPATQKISTVNHQEIASWHLFGAKSEKKAAPRPEKIIAPVTRLKLTLRGIAAEENKHDGVAIIQQPNKQEKHFKVGDSIFGLAKLEEIHTDKVILSRKGQYETLHLAKLDLHLRPAAPAATPGIRKTSVQTVTPALLPELNDETGLDDETELDDDFWEYIDYEPAIVNGKIAGLTIIADETDQQEFLASHGLKAGDIITSVNGHIMNSGKGVSDAINALADDDRLEIAVTSQGNKKKLVIDR